MNRNWIKVMLLLVLFAGIVDATKAIAQSGKLPPFQMMQGNGKIFKAQDLPMGKPIVLVYFDPTCDHCNTLMKAMLAKTKELQKASIALVTYVPAGEVKKFEDQYKLSRFTNLYTGTEGNTFFLKNYYKLTNMPFMALYTQMGDLVKIWPNETGLPDLLNRLGQLK